MGTMSEESRYTMGGDEAQLEWMTGQRDWWRKRAEGLAEEMAQRVETLQAEVDALTSLRRARSLFDSDVRAVANRTKRWEL